MLPTTWILRLKQLIQFSTLDEGITWREGGWDKPVVRRKFVRVKETLYRLGDWRIRVTLKSWELCLDFDLSKVWFRRRVGSL